MAPPHMGHSRLDRWNDDVEEGTREVDEAIVRKRAATDEHWHEDVVQVRDAPPNNTALTIPGYSWASQGCLHKGNLPQGLAAAPFAPPAGTDTDATKYRR